ncbi:hypothetical protein HUJ05_005151 [Dendroctonus ponderosae]|nr:hypothetical protein HUJ05_005151 [Dendroctonus ponderosae]
MILTQDRQRLSRAVGILIVLQGTTWFALALTGLIVLYSPPTSLTDTSMTAYTKYSQYLGRIIYNDFMIESQTRTISKVIRPTDFAAFLWIYVILSALWVVASLDQNLAIRYKKSRQSHITLVLGISTLLISLLDLVFFSLLARDFSTKPPSPSDDLVFYDDNDRFSPPGAPAKGTRGVTGTPVALNNKNQNIYY